MYTSVAEVTSTNGNSSQRDRIDLLNQFVSLAGKGKIYNLLSDLVIVREQ